MGGWLGGCVGKIKNKDQLSQAETEVETELGNMKLMLQIGLGSDQRVTGNPIGSAAPSNRGNITLHSMYFSFSCQLHSYSK